MITFLESLGFFTSPEESPDDSLQRTNRFGAIPGVGIVIGGGRLYAACSPEAKLSILTRIGYVVRAVFEILGLGLLFVVAFDIPVDVFRGCSSLADHYASHVADNLPSHSSQ